MVMYKIVRRWGGSKIALSEITLLPVSGFANYADSLIHGAKLSNLTF